MRANSGEVVVIARSGQPAARHAAQRPAEPLGLPLRQAQLAGGLPPPFDLQADAELIWFRHI